MASIIRDDLGDTVTDEQLQGRSQTSRLIRAPREQVYRAFTDPAALVSWLVPGEMTGRIHVFDARVGGGYSMSLFYPLSEDVHHGKTAEREDRYTARYLELTPPARIVQEIIFDTTDAALSQPMTMIVTLEDRAGDTEVTIAFEHIPAGIRPEDNDAGTQSSLEKLAGYVEQGENSSNPAYD